MGWPLFGVITSGAIFRDESSTSVGSRHGAFASDPFVDVGHAPPSRPSRNPAAFAAQFKGGRFRRGNLLPAVFLRGACTFVVATALLPFRGKRSLALIFVVAIRLLRRFDSWRDEGDADRGRPFMTSSIGRLPVASSVGAADSGGDLRLIFIRIPLSTMVARWSDDELDIFCSAAEAADAARCCSAARRRSWWRLSAACVSVRSAAARRPHPAYSTDRLRAAAGRVNKHWSPSDAMSSVLRTQRTALRISPLTASRQRWLSPDDTANTILCLKKVSTVSSSAIWTDWNRYS